MENLCKAAKTEFCFVFFHPFFLILIQFRLQTAIPHTASGHLTWSIPENLPITVVHLLIPLPLGLL